MEGRGVREAVVHGISTSYGLRAGLLVEWCALCGSTGYMGQATLTVAESYSRVTAK